MESLQRLMGRSIRPEQELLLCCCRPSLEPSHRQTISRLLEEPLSWEDLHGEADRHGLLPLLYRHLSTVAQGVCPEHLLDRWRSVSTGVLLVNSLLCSELSAIQEQLCRSEIPMLAIKGPALAWLLYGNLGLRSSTDLDLLVSKQHVHAASDVLLQRGYAASIPLVREWEDALIERYVERSFWRSQPSTIVDLHWGLMPREMTPGQAFDRVWGNSQTVQLGQALIATLGDEDLLLFLCFHGAKHGWSRLLWLCDLAELIRTRTSLDWDRVRARAAAHGGRRMLDLSLRLAHDALGAPVPAEILRDADNSAAVKALAQEAIAGLLPAALPAVAPSNRLWQSLYRFRLLDRRRDQLRSIYGSLSPGLAEWQLLRLPAILAPAYYVIRLVRLFTKYLRLSANAEC